jgi:Zn-dependent alcohol dehydrogenase
VRWLSPKLLEVTLFAVDTNETRLAFCRDQLHIPYSLNPNSSQIIESLMEITSGDMPSVVIDATGRIDAINQAFIICRIPKIYSSFAKDEIHFSQPEFHKREAL